MRKPKWIITLTAALAIAAVVIIAGAKQPGCTEVAGRGLIRIPAAALSRGAIRFFCFRDADGARLRFILARDESGNLHSVLDACERCGSFHKGYTAFKDELICRVCGNRYKIPELETGKASCIPRGLKAVERAGQIEINSAGLREEGAG